MTQPADAAPLTPDLCVIGAGTAGYQAALAAGLMGAATVLVEKADMAAPLARAGDLAWQAVLAAVAGPVPPPDWGRVRARALGVARATAPDRSAERLAALGVRVIRAVGRFRDANTLEAGPHLVRARRFLLATGSAPPAPVLPGLDLVPVLTADTLLESEVLPRRLAILGGDAFGIEAAQVFRRLGSEVAVIEAGVPLAAFDAELSAAVLGQLAAEGVALHAGARVLRVEPAGGAFRIAFTSGEDAGPERALEATHILVAGDRAPNLAEWRPDRARVACSTRGVGVRPNGRTGNARIFAAGDVTGLATSAQGAQAQATVALRASLFRLPARFDPRMVPRVLRTTPPLAAVGLTETEARGRAGTIQVLRWPFSDNERARAEGRTGGHVKVITASDGRVLGAGIVGAEAIEAIGLWTLAVAENLKASDIAALPLPLGTFSDASRRAALSALSADLGRPWVRRALALARRLG